MRRRRIVYFGLALVALLRPPPAWCLMSGEELLFSEIPPVAAASRFEQDASDAPASVTVVTATEIQRLGFRTLADVLRSVTGVFTINDGNYTYVGVRGIVSPGDYNSRLLLLVDGQRLNENVYGAAYFGTEGPVDLSAVERIEFVRGPASSLYGASAVLGVVNIVTRNGADATGAGVAVGVEGNDGLLGEVTWGSAAGAATDAFVSAAGWSTDGERMTLPDSGPVSDGADADRARRAFASVERNGWSVHGLYSDRVKHVPTGSYGTIPGDARTRTEDRLFSTSVAWRGAVAGGNGFATIAYNDYHYAGRYAYETDELYDRVDGRWGVVEAGYDRAIGRHRLVAGLSFQRNFEQSYASQDAQGTDLVPPTRASSSQWALFAQDEMRFGERWIASVGVRYDHYDTFGGTTNPRLAVIRRFGSGDALKLLYGRAFRAPNFSEIAVEDGLTVKGNSDLEPERFETWELVYERRFGREARWSAAAFAADLRDTIVQGVDPGDGLLVYRNAGEVDAEGVEFELAGKIGDVSMQAAATLQRSRDDATRERLPFAPETIVQGSAVVPLPASGNLGATLRWIGDRLDREGGNVPGHVVLDLRVGFPLRRGFDVSFDVSNALDEAYADPVGEDVPATSVPQAGRNWRLMLRWSGGR
jgi:iron complex outermembrane receptor protein